MKILAPNFISVVSIASVFFALLFATFPTLAFDCSKASTPTEKAIFSDADLKLLDDKMAHAYFGLQAILLKSGKAVLKRSQRFWLNFRNHQCDAGIDCLNEETRAHLSNLQSTPLKMVPLFIWQKGDLYQWEIKISAYEFTTSKNPGHRLFNQELSKHIEAIALGEKTEKQEISPWEREMFMNISRVNERMISVSLGNYEYAGGAHPNSWRDMINVNLRTGKLLETNALFSNDAISKLRNSCQNQIVSQKYQDADGDNAYKLKLLEEEYPGVVDQHIRDMRRWDFDNESIQIVFNSYAIGAYVEGPFGCEFSNDLLQSLATDKALLLP